MLADASYKLLFSHIKHCTKNEEILNENFIFCAVNALKKLHLLADISPGRYIGFHINTTLKRLSFFTKSVKPHFYLRIHFADFIKNTNYFTHYLNSFVGFL